MEGSKLVSRGDTTRSGPVLVSVSDRSSSGLNAASSVVGLDTQHSVAKQAQMLFRRCGFDREDGEDEVEDEGGEGGKGCVSGRLVG